MLKKDEMVVRLKKLINENPHKSSWVFKFKKLDKEVYDWIFEVSQFLDEHTRKVTFNERVYVSLNSLESIQLCECGKPLNFAEGKYFKHCSKKCPCKHTNAAKVYKKNYLDKHGVDNPMKIDSIKTKMKESIKEKYGVENVAHLESVISKRKQTMSERYGEEVYTRTKDYRDKVKETSRKNYGTDHPTQSEEVKRKVKKTFLKNYGVDNPNKNDSIRDKIKQSCMNKFGLKTNLLIEDIHLKAIESRIQNQSIKYIDKINNNLSSNVSFIERMDKFKFKFKCSDCNNEFIIDNLYTINMRIFRDINSCPICEPLKNHTSSLELECRQFFDDNDIEYETNNRSIISPKELDIYIPSCNTAIELNGIYWHSEIYVDDNYHVEKFKMCYKKGIRLIQIFEDEWINKKEIVKSRILHILDKCKSKRVHARKCIIREIDSKKKNDFLENYHIQGKDNSKVKLGAFHDDELISVMTFSKGNISKGSKSLEGVWELNRFCTKRDIHSPGIASKMLTHFKKKYKWNKIFSYADLRWSQGKVYQNLGFSLISVSKPNYWYVLGQNRVHRFNFRKSTLTEMENFSDELSEREIMLLEGIPRLYDCGNLKFETINKYKGTNNKRSY